MDNKYTGEMYKHLEKQYELLMEAYRLMSHERRRLEVEEEMLMRKFYHVTTNQDATKKTREDKRSILDLRKSEREQEPLD
ncbi:hypothetical protein ACHQM5_005041 [Ranunculus cassubicifolius]